MVELAPRHRDGIDRERADGEREPDAEAAAAADEQRRRPDVEGEEREARGGEARRARRPGRPGARRRRCRTGPAPAASPEPAASPSALPRPSIDFITTKTNRNAPTTSKRLDPGRAEARARQRPRPARPRRPPPAARRSACVGALDRRRRRRRAAAAPSATRTVRSPNSGAKTSPISGPSAISAPARRRVPRAAACSALLLSRARTRRARATTTAASDARQQPAVGRRSGNRRGRQHQVMRTWSGARRDARPRRGQDARSGRVGVAIRSRRAAGRASVEQHLARGDVVVVDGEPLEELERLGEARRTERRPARCCAAGRRARRRWSPPDRSAPRRASRPAAVR